MTQFTKEQLIARIERQIDMNATIVERLGDDSAAVSELAVETATMDMEILDTALAALTAPQLPQPAVADEDDNFYSWFGREWHENYQQNQYTTAAKQMLGVMAESAWRAGRRAAMLQGKADKEESVTTIKPVADLFEVTVPSGRSTTFTTDAAEGKDCADMGWKVQEYVTLERYQAAMLQGNHRDLSQPVDPQVAEYEKIMDQALPEGMVAVPVEPTAEMLAELCLVEGWTERALQARYKAMLAAAPQQEDPHQKK